MKIEGKNAVIEAINSSANFTVEKILISANMKNADAHHIISLAKQNNIAFSIVPGESLGKNIKNKHQGVVAYCTAFKYSQVSDILKVAKERNQHHFIAILDGIEDPHNFGSIIRVCECLGVHGIIIGKNRACSVNDTVIKTSAGATSHVKIAKVTNINHIIEDFKKENIWIYACELGGTNLQDANLTGNIAVVIGSEGRGVSDLTKKLCDGILTITMKGQINSLNASVAAGIVLHEVSKQR